MLISLANLQLTEHTHTHTTVLRLCGFCSGQPRWAGTRRNIHPLTLILVINHPYLLSPYNTIHGILPIPSTCFTFFFHNLSPSFLWSTSWRGTLHFILHTLHCNKIQLYHLWHITNLRFLSILYCTLYKVYITSRNEPKINNCIAWAVNTAMRAQKWTNLVIDWSQLSLYKNTSHATVNNSRKYTAEWHYFNVKTNNFAQNQSLLN